MAKRSTPRKRAATRGRGLSSERIAAAALELLDAEGLGALSARRLASELGCEAMSLYHHVSGMNGVLDGVVDEVLRELDLPRAGDTDWVVATRAMARSYLTMASAHPHAMGLVAGRRWRTPAALRTADATIALFRRAGFAPRAALRAARILGAYLNGSALALAAWRLASGEPPSVPDRLDLPELRPLLAASNERSVFADLEAGIDLLIPAIERLAET